MKPIHGTIIAGERLGGKGFDVTIQTPDGHAEIILSKDITVIDLKPYELSGLRDLRYYLADRPALDESEVKYGIQILNRILGDTNTQRPPPKD